MSAWRLCQADSFKAISPYFTAVIRLLRKTKQIASRVALCTRENPERYTEHAYANSSQNNQDNDSYEAGDYGPAGNNL